MDLIRTLGIAIDASGAKAGAAAAAQAFKDIGAAAASADKAIAGTRKEMDTTGRSMGGARRAADLLRETLGFSPQAKAVVSVLSSVVESLAKTETESRRAASALRVASGSTEEFAKNQLFVRDASEALGLDLHASSLAFAKLAASAKGTGLEGEPIRDLFLSTARAATVLELSVDETSSAINAFAQMLSKGSVKADELRGQVGERLYGVFTLAAKGMGVTTQELNKMLESGNVLAKNLIPALTREMNKAFGPDAATGAQSLTAEMNRLSNSWTDFQKAINNTGISSLFTEAASGARDFLKILTAAVDKVNELKQWATKAAPNVVAAAWDSIKYTAVPALGLLSTAREAVKVGAEAVTPKETVARQAKLVAAPPPPTNLEGPMMAPFKVGPTRWGAFREGLGLGVFEPVERERKSIDAYGNTFTEKVTVFENRFTNTMKNMTEAGTMAIDSLHAGFSGFFDNLIDGTMSVSDAFRNMARSILSDLAKIIARQAIVNPIVGSLGEFIGIKPASFKVSSPTGHTGGIVGASFGSTYLRDPALFAGAPRLHDGLAPDEFPAILQRGERVVPKSQAGAWDRGGGDININVNVDGSRGGTPAQNKAFGAEVARQIEAMVDARIARAAMPRGILRPAASYA